jgi:hypothetical protein
MKSGQYNLFLNRHLDKFDLCAQTPFCPRFEVSTIGFNSHLVLFVKIRFGRFCIGVTALMDSLSSRVT